MGQLAFLKTFMLVSIPTDRNDNQRHIHVFTKGGRKKHSVAKIWIERNGEKCLEIANSSLSSKDNDLLISAIEKNWDFLNRQIDKSFKGEKTIVKDLEKKEGDKYV